jgi:hypothetical protein
MLRKTLIALSAAAALGVSSGAMAASHGGHGASSGSSGAMQGHSGGGMQGPGTFSKGSAQSFGGTMGPSQVRPMGPSQVRPMGSSQVRPTGPSGQAWNGGQWGHHRHHHRHDRFFFGVGFAGPYYDYGYDSCWRIVPTYYGGWQRVWVCGDYPYGGYYGGY